MKKADSILSPFSLQKNNYIHSYYGNKINCAYDRSAQPRVKKKEKKQCKILALYQESLPKRCTSCELLKAAVGILILLL